MKKSRGGDFKPSITEIEKSCRLCIHTNVLSFFSSKPFGPRAVDQYVNIHAAFKLLRVLDVLPFVITVLPNDLTQLVHLRHIALSGDFQILPRAFSKLWNLQTLIVYITSFTLEIKADIWKMVKLRHVKTNTRTTLPKPGKSTKECNKLQTLGKISLENLTEDVFERVRSLRKLGIMGRLLNILNGKGLEKLDNVEKLKLVFGAMGPGFLQAHELPPKLKSLTISTSFFDWSHMSTLAMLDTLEVLKLNGRTFSQESWAMTDGRFRHLEVLHIVYTNLRIWTATARHFPKLRCLVLKYCKYLKEIPFGVGENLQQLKLVHVSSSATASARKIEQAKRQHQGKETFGSSGFKFFIDPADS